VLVDSAASTVVQEVERILAELESRAIVADSPHRGSQFV
jgi:hypothetical protein